MDHVVYYIALATFAAMALGFLFVSIGEFYSAEARMARAMARRRALRSQSAYCRLINPVR